MNRRQKIAVVMGIAALTWEACIPMASADITDDEIAAARSAESKAATSVAQIESKLASLEAEANDLELASAQAEVANTQAQSRLWDAMDAAAAAQARADEAAYKVEEGRVELGRIGAALYREGAGAISGAGYLLGVDSLSEASDKAHAYDLVGRSAKSDLNEFQALDDVATALQKEADRKFAEHTKAAEEAEKAARALDKQAKEAAQRVADIDNERDELVAVLAEKRGVTQELVSQQQQEKAEAARKAAAAEAARLRAAEQERMRQEAARVAAQQAAQQAAQAAQQTARPQPQPQPAPAPAPAPALAASGLGNQIVAFARNYVGVPYVWGGTSPVYGWDCSGYVGYVYRNFGINLPRTTYGMEAAGYMPVSYANAKPGDLVLWPGHVGIYTGNGMHIAAQRPGLGTQETPLYGNYHFVRVVNY